MRPLQLPEISTGSVCVGPGAIQKNHISSLQRIGAALIVQLTGTTADKKTEIGSKLVSLTLMRKPSLKRTYFLQMKEVGAGKG